MKKTVKNIVFRVDSGNHIGFGHLSRCLVLAHAFYQKNYEIHFVTKNHPGNFNIRIPSCYKIHLLNYNIDNFSPDKADYLSWLGSSLEDDFFKFYEVLLEIGNIQLIVIDNYSLDIVYEEKLSKYKLFVIDGLSRSHCCDYLLDQNIGSDKMNYEKKKQK